MTNLRTRIHHLREALHAGRKGRAQRRQLERELAAYATPNDRLEIEQIVARYSDDETRQIRQILNRQAA